MLIESDAESSLFLLNLYRETKKKNIPQNMNYLGVVVTVYDKIG